ncbi:YrdB family protein [Paenibacillus sp. P26]|nr:YrdB family protein [Paenibacillus sp. P26]
MILTIVNMVVPPVFFLLELAALAALGYWGFHTGTGWTFRWSLGVGTPSLVAILWGTFVAPKASIPVSVPVRILLQLAVFGSAAAALYASGYSKLAVIFIATAVVEMALVHSLKL